MKGWNLPTYSSDTTETIYLLQTSVLLANVTQVPVPVYILLYSGQSNWSSVAYRGGVVQTPPRNSEDIGGILDRTSKKNRRLDFLL